jgi:hypothetical protein
VLSEPAAAPPKRPRPDGFQYQLAIARDGREADRTYWEPVASAAARALIELLDARAVLSH